MQLAMSSDNLLLLFVSVSVSVVAAALQYYLRRRGNNRSKCCKIPAGYTIWSSLSGFCALLKPTVPTTLGDSIKDHIQRRGKIFTINLVGKPVIVSTDTELTKLVLQNDMKLFTEAWHGGFRAVIGETNITLQVGDAHRLLKSIILNFINEGKHLNSIFQENVDLIATQIFKSWQDGSTVSVFTAAKQFAFNVIAKNTLGLDQGDPKTETLREPIAIIAAKIFSSGLNFPGSHYNKCLKSRAIVLKVIKQIMEERAKSEESTKVKSEDLLTTVMKNGSLSEEQIGDFFQGLLFAGSDTVTTAICLSIYFLGNCPKAVEKLQEEYLQVLDSKMQCGERKLIWDDYKKMEFTQCVINETLRLGNIAQSLIKKANTDIQFKDYVIPRGSTVIVSMAAVHLDPSVFKDPEHFNPWRWLSSSGIMKTKYFMAFGGGPRMCTGVELARFEIAVFIHHLISKFRWTLGEDDHPILQPRIKFPEGLPIKVHSRPLDF